MQNRRRAKSNFGVKRNGGFQSNRKRSGGGPRKNGTNSSGQKRYGSFKRNSGNVGQRNSKRPRGEKINPNRFIQREVSDELLQIMRQLILFVILDFVENYRLI